MVRSFFMLLRSIRAENFKKRNAESAAALYPFAGCFHRDRGAGEGQNSAYS
jgi:hypothetical protein